MSRTGNSAVSTQESMRAAVYYKYGSPDNISVIDIEKPAPKDGEVLIRVKAASVNAYDWHLLRAKPFFTRFLSGVFKPANNILGADVSGVVVSAGPGASRFKPGDKVYGCLESCGKGGLAAGGFAEYVCAKESVLAPAPIGLSFEEAAALPMAAVTALQGIRDMGQIKRGMKVLINGASGGVGSFAVQIAKAYGAEVTAVCSTGSMDLARSLGADRVIDYKKENFAEEGEKYDVILDIAASRSVKDYRRALKTGGVCVVIGFSTIGHMISVLLAGKRDGKGNIGILTANNKIGGDLLELNKLIEAGKLKAVIDSQYPLEAVSDAIRRVETGHPKGKVIISSQLPMHE